MSVEKAECAHRPCLVKYCLTLPRPVAKADCNQLNNAYYALASPGSGGSNGTLSHRENTVPVKSLDTLTQLADKLSLTC